MIIELLADCDMPLTQKSKNQSQIIAYLLRLAESAKLIYNATYMPETAQAKRKVKLKSWVEDRSNGQRVALIPSLPTSPFR